MSPLVHHSLLLVRKSLIGQPLFGNAVNEVVVAEFARFLSEAVGARPAASSNSGEDFLLFLFGGHLHSSLVDKNEGI